MNTCSYRISEVRGIEFNLIKYLPTGYRHVLKSFRLDDRLSITQIICVYRCRIIQLHFGIKCHAYSALSHVLLPNM